MRCRIPLIFALLCGFLMVGCDQQPAEPPINLAGATPAFDIGNAPGASGAVIRLQDGVGLVWTDGNTGLQVILGVDIRAFCTGPADFDVITFQDIFAADRPILEVGQGTVQTSVWGFTGFDCGLFTTEDPLASGYSDLLFQDNDLLGAFGDHNANAWGYQAHGTLTADGGEDVAFSAFLRQKWNGSQGYSFASGISLH